MMKLVKELKDLVYVIKDGIIHVFSFYEISVSCHLQIFGQCLYHLKTL